MLSLSGTSLRVQHLNGLQREKGRRGRGEDLFLLFALTHSGLSDSACHLLPGELSQAPCPRAANLQSPSLSWFCPRLCPHGVGRRCEKWDEPGQGAAVLLSHKLLLCPWGLTSGLQNMRDLTRPSLVPTPGCGFPCHPSRYS